MLLQKELKKLFQQLVLQNVAHVEYEGVDIAVHVLDNNSKLSLSAEVYLGSNYIPKSVRVCIASKPPFVSDHIKTKLIVEEGNFRIILHYLGAMEDFNSKLFQDLLEEFCWLTREWRVYLDEHDKHDLVHIYVK